MSSGIAAQRRTGAPVVGEVLMDASISSSHLLLPMLVSHLMNLSTDLKHIRSSHPAFLFLPISTSCPSHLSSPIPLLPPTATRQFADGGTYSQKTLSESILEVEKIRKSFEAKKQAERVERALKEGELRAGDVDVLVSRIS
jgi:hypothetical protein